MKEINCNLCGQNNTKVIFRSKDRRINIKAEKELSWKPKYSLDEGLEEDIQWFKIKNN